MKTIPPLLSWKKALMLCAVSGCLAQTSLQAYVVTLDSSTTTATQLVTTISAATPGTIFRLTGAGWTLDSRLDIPAGVTLLGGGNGGTPVTITRGFNGTSIATVQSYVTITGITFDGNKANYMGDGVVAGEYSGSTLDPAGATVLGMMWNNVTIKNCSANAFVLSSIVRQAIFQNCTFNGNDASGVLHAAPSASSHSLNRWESCIFSNNAGSAVSFVGTESCPVFENCQFINNTGVVFDYDSGTDTKTYGITVRDSLIANNGGPAWLNRTGEGAVAFVNCRIKDNGASPPSGLTAPIGLFHIEGGLATLEVRGGSDFTGNSADGFTTTAGSVAGSKLTLSSGEARLGNINAPNATFFTMDTTFIPTGSPIVSEGIGLDPTTGTLIQY